MVCFSGRTLKNAAIANVFPLWWHDVFDAGYFSTTAGSFIERANAQALEWPQNPGNAAALGRLMMLRDLLLLRFCF